MHAQGEEQKRLTHCCHVQAFASSSPIQADGLLGLNILSADLICTCTVLEISVSACTFNTGPALNSVHDDIQLIWAEQESSIQAKLNGDVGGGRCEGNQKASVLVHPPRFEHAARPLLGKELACFRVHNPDLDHGVDHDHHHVQGALVTFNIPIQ